jgi:hypothetical protein
VVVADQAVAASVAVGAADVQVAAVDAVVADPAHNPLSAENTMTHKFNIKAIALALLVSCGPMLQSAHAAPAKAAMAQQHFTTPAEAAKALADALRSNNVNALVAVVGPKSRSWLSSGDAVADKQGWALFLQNYERQHSISETSDGKAFLLVGEDLWPFPAPLVKKPTGWVFDTAAGREEVLNRRIGHNELSAIQTLLATVDAQREYAAGDLDGNGFNDYASRFVSSPGKRDGLFWPVTANETLSPLGPLVGAAAREGYNKKHVEKAAPYHGYFFRMLGSQGKDAPGGAYSYEVNGRKIGGFAVLAYPAKYGSSGVMSFLVNHDGAVYQKNLGKNTAASAQKIRSFNPDSSWAKTQ